MSKLFLVLFLALTPTAFATIWYVDGVNGNDSNDCKTRTTACKTMGHAISLASSGDTIGVGPATYTENLTIAISLTLIGSGASTTVIDGRHGGVVVTVNPKAKVSLSKFTIRNGYAYISGGIYNIGTLRINQCSIVRNTAYSVQGFAGIGGGITNGGTLTINNSTLSGNSAPFRGGGIYNFGALTISNTTISGNASDFGGATYTQGNLTINNSTLSGNSTGSRGRAIETSGAIVTFQNSIVANSSSLGNCIGTMTSKGYNLSSDTTCNFSGPGDLNNTNPRLGTLGNYGGPTQTIPLLSGSPAIDAGNPNGCADGNGHLLKTDQRGAPRPDKEDTGGCDMGAFERQSD